MRQLNAILFLIAISNITYKVSAQTEPDISFAETVYAKLSSACRAIMNLQFDSMNSQNDILKTMRILYLDGEIISNFLINDAYKSLTKAKRFDITKQTKIILHGYRDSSQSSVSLDLAKTYNNQTMFNVLLVDAEQMMNQRYMLSVHNARLIGKRLANLLANLEDHGANAIDFHLLGISLGAHIAGWAGKYFQRYKMRKLGRITGLDPAGPCFSHAYQDQRLDKLDAVYVDVIHTNKLVQGITEPLGHADFYVNGGGPQQPGCFMPSCSHLRATQLYVESIKNPKSFIGVRCQSWNKFESNLCEEDNIAVLGYGSSSSTKGVYYLRTTSKSPFGLGMNGTKNDNIRSVDPLLVKF